MLLQSRSVRVSRQALVRTTLVVVSSLCLFTSAVNAQDAVSARREEERQLLKTQDQIDSELDRIVIAEQTSGSNLPAKEREAALERSKVLNKMRDTVGMRLKDLARELREGTRKEAQSMFAGPVDVFMEGTPVGSGNTP